MSLSGLFWRPCYCGPAALTVLALCLSQSPARAGDLEDCNSNIAEKMASGCTAVINNPATPPADNVKALVNRARLHTNRGEFDPALADADAALKLDSQSLSALLVRGFAYERKNNFDAALADFNRAAEIDPKVAGPIISRGYLRIQQRNWPDALKDFDQALTLRSDLATAHSGRGRAYLEMGDLDKALAALDEAIALSINTPNAFYLRGQVYRRKGDLDHAIDDFTRAAVQAQPNDVGPYIMRGQLYSSKGDYPRALADFDKVLSIAPGDKNAQQLRASTLALQTALAHSHDTPVASAPAPIPTPGAASPVTSPAASPAAPPQTNSPTATPSPQQLTEQARLLAGQQKYDDAIAPLTQALTIDPHFDAALRLRIAVYTKVRKLKEALADMNELVKLHPDDARLLAGHGLALAGNKQRDQGLSEIERSLAIDPKNAYGYFARGFVKRLSGKPDEALSDFDLSIAINPKDANAFVQRGMTHIALNDIDKALLDFDKALTLNPLDDNARAARGLALLTKGNIAEGLPDINRVLERNPKNELALLGRGIELLSSGQSDRAIAVFNQLVEGPSDDDISPRMLRARAFLLRKDTANAMQDLNYVLNFRPGNAEALTLRGIAFSGTQNYDKALADLNQGLGKLETIEGYFTRAKIYELKNDVPHATADFRRAAELKPKSLFDLVAQVEARKQVEQLSKRLPCGSSGRSQSDGACL